MPFNTRAAFKLTLAIAAICAQAAQAQDSGERLWSCNLTPSGEWDCEVNEELMQQEATPAPRMSATPAESESVNEYRTPETEAPASLVSESAAETIEPENEVRVGTAPDAPAVRRSGPTPIEWPRPVSSQTVTDSPTPQPVAQQVGAAADPTDWSCVAVNGEWDCSRQGTATSPASAATARSVAASAPMTGQPEWSCAAEGDEWACEQVATRAPAQPVRRAAAMPVSRSDLDWYAYAPGEAPGACSGRYIEPEFAFLEDDRPFDQQPVFVNALTSSTELGGITQLEGGVEIQRGGRLLTSTRGEFDQSANNAFMFGQVRYREAGLLLLSEEAEADLISGDTRFNNARYVMHQEHMRGSADSITRFGDRRVRLDRGAITYCEPGSNAWQIAARSIELNPETGRGVAKHATFDVAGVPILYTPYLSFPIDDRRQSGFLYPSFGYSESDGLDIAIPYYFNLAENFDDTLTPRYISERGLLLENEFRYMNQWSHSTLSTAWLGSDSQYGDNRWLFGVDHRGRPYDNLYSRIDYTKVSDDKYFSDLGTSLEVQRDNHLDQLMELRYLQPNWNLSLRTHSYQTIGGATPYERLPQLLLSGRESAVAGMFNLDYQAEYTRFERDLDSVYAPTSALAATVGDRVHLRPRLSLSLNRPWGYLRPAATFWHSSYDLDNERDANRAGSDSISAGILSIDSGLVFEREFGLAEAQYTQTLEPRLFLLHSDADEQLHIPAFDSSQLDFSYYSLFHETGWSGNDRVADTQQATLGLSSALYNDQGAEKIRVGVAQAQYLADREHAGRPGDPRAGSDAGSSNLATLAQWNITPSLRLTHDGEIDRDSYEFLEHNYKLSYLPGDKRLLYVSYRDNVDKNPGSFDSVQQLDMAFRWPINNSWTGYGRWQQDLENNENLETLLGVEYATCCWKVRFTGRSWVVNPDLRRYTDADQFETDTGVFLQFVFRGLGAFGQSGGREFLEDITGYDEDDNGSF